MISPRCALLVTLLLLPACGSTAPASETGDASPDVVELPPDAPSDLAEFDASDAPADAPEAGMPDVPADDADDADAADEPDDVVDVQPPECAPPAQTGPLQVRTAWATFEGTAEDDVLRFAGIPFAAPPVGEGRWRPPASPSCEAEVRPAAELGPACAQNDRATGDPEGSEDCLTLNVWTPALDAAARPVLVFIHGGGNVIGSAVERVVAALPRSALLYNGADLARSGAVVDTLQYRLGPFGFLAHPALAGDGAGNYGLLDQIAALEWVRDNISAFGGDPARVMIFGESAGAVNVCSLVASPRAAGLFRAAIMESGACTAKPLAAAESAALEGAAAAGCVAADGAGCLRGLDTIEVLAALGGEISIGDPGPGGALSYGPVIDGEVLPEPPLKLLRDGRHNAVQLVAGSNADEMADLLTFEVETEEELRRMVALSFGFISPGATETILAAYPLEAFASPQEAAIAIWTDARFTCSVERTLAALATGQPGKSTWRYFFSRRPPTADGELPAAHGLELLYVFGTLEDIPGYRPAAEDSALSNTMQSAWISLAAGLDPSVDGVTWPVWGPSDPYVDLGTDVTTASGLRNAECDMWLGLIGE